MIRKKHPKTLTIDIDGPEGNAHVLLGYATLYADELDLNKSEILNDMKSGDYYHLLSVFMKAFPWIVIETANDEILSKFADDLKEE